MKRILVLLVALLSLASVYASFDVGYNATLVGESYGNVSFAGAELSASLDFTKEKHVGDIGVDVIFSFDQPGFRGVNVTASTSLFQMVSESRFFPNAVLWEPKLTLGYQYRTDAGQRVMVGLSPICFAATGFLYEFFSPYLTMDTEKNLGWGIRIMKFTAYL